jgi:1-acyl-sn-glycerol-3-phosphate acyltransferase
MNMRRGRRAVALACALMVCMVRLGRRRLRGPLTPVQRALWLQSACRGVLRSLGIGCRVTGTPPSHGLVVSNHLSYLDIAIYSAVMPCVFVSKAEVEKWPYFGWAARAGNTVFLDRSSRASAAAAVAEISNRLKLPIPVLLFPEGTSTDGSQVLRFHSTLFQAAIDTAAPVTAAAVRYGTEAEVAERELCWFGDEGFLSHLWKALGAPACVAEVSFAEPRTYADRRRAATLAHDAVAALRAQDEKPPVDSPEQGRAAGRREVRV